VACYTPDIVIETMTEKILCEVKSEKDMTDSIVLQKADAGSTWCEKASKNDSKPWVYVLISEKEIEKRPNLDINGLKAFGMYTKRNL
jgi:type III restriction enzyme